MIDPRTLVYQTLDFASPEHVPRQLWVLPWAHQHHPDQLSWLQKHYPPDIVSAPPYLKTLPTFTGHEYAIGEFIDDWGCCFTNVHDGVIGIVKDPLIKEWSDLEKLHPPEEVLTVDVDKVNDFCRSTDTFVLSGCCPRPFERFQFLRTMEQAFMDLLMEPPELADLLHIIHEQYCKEIELWARTDVDAISFMDDWGSQQGLLIAPDLFRKFFKPMYEEYATIAKDHGKRVFMHSDGFIFDIYKDLIEIGVDAVNSQLFCMDIEEIGRRYAGRITFWGEIDRQQLLPYGSLEDIRNAVERVQRNLFKNGGVIAQCEFGAGAKPDNVIEVFKMWDKILG